MPDDQATEQDLLDVYNALSQTRKADLREIAKKLAEHPAPAPKQPLAIAI